MSIPFGFGQDDNNELAGIFESIGKMLRHGPTTGAVDWESARTASAETLKAAGDTPSLNAPSALNATHMADLWLNDVTIFPSSGHECTALSRAQWLESTFDSWKAIVEPVAEGVAAAMTGMMPSSEQIGSMQIPDELLNSLPPEMAANMREMLENPDIAALTGPVMAMAQSMGATMFGMQFGQALGTMATEVLSATDIGIPLGSDSRPMLIAANVDEFARGLTIDPNDVYVYVALRELAHQRLFSHAPWLTSQVLSAIGDYARGVRVDNERIQEAISQIDPSDPNALNDALGGNLFESAQTPEQTAALNRLEVLLALIEGWITTVVTQATGGRLPAADALEETFRRRRAAGGPTERLFAGLVGLEIHPRRIREATALWNRIGEISSVEKRDNLWSHPDLLPRAEDLDNAETFLMESNYDLMTELSKAIEAGSHDEQED